MKTPIHFPPRYIGEYTVEGVYMKLVGVYIIRNLVNGKMYVGSSISIKARWQSHKQLLNKNKHHSPSLQRAWNKYGKENFKHEIIEIVEDTDKLLEREQYWIDTLDTFGKGYNVCKVAGNRLGVKHDEGVKTLVAFANMGRTVSKENRLKTSKRFKGIKQTAEHIYKRTQKHVGMKRSKKTCDLIAEKATGRLHSELSKIKMSENRKGESNARSILSETDIPIIRKRLADGEVCRIIAESYGVERSTINNIKRGKTWKHVI